MGTISIKTRTKILRIIRLNNSSSNNTLNLTIITHRCSPRNHEFKQAIPLNIAIWTATPHTIQVTHRTSKINSREMMPLTTSKDTATISNNSHHHWYLYHNPLIKSILSNIIINSSKGTYLSSSSFSIKAEIIKLPGMPQEANLAIIDCKYYYLLSLVNLS